MYGDPLELITNILLRFNRDSTRLTAKQGEIVARGDTGGGEKWKRE